MEQTLEIKIVFQTVHEPGTENHLKSVAESYLQAKGIKCEDGVIMI